MRSALTSPKSSSSSSSSSSWASSGSNSNLSLGTNSKRFMGSYRSTIMVVGSGPVGLLTHRNPTGPAYFAPQTSTTVVDSSVAWHHALFNKGAEEGHDATNGGSKNGALVDRGVGCGERAD